MIANFYPLRLGLDLRKGPFPLDQELTLVSIINALQHLREDRASALLDHQGDVNEQRREGVLGLSEFHWAFMTVDLLQGFRVLSRRRDSRVDFVLLEDTRGRVIKHVLQIRNNASPLGRMILKNNCY